MAPGRVNDRRPNNLDQAPELLTQAMASYALGMSVEAINALERDDADFPKRRRVPFMQRAVFLRSDLQRWVAAQLEHAPQAAS